MTLVKTLRQHGRVYTVEFDDQPPMRCERRFLSKVSLAEGQDIEPRLLDRLRDAAAEDLALAMGQRWLAQRARSRSDLTARLRREGFASEVIEGTLEALRAQGALDDRAFALSWVEKRLRRNPRAARLLRKELEQQGIESQVAAAATANVDDDALALELAADKLRRAGDDWQRFRREAVPALLRKGFTADVVMDALRAAWRERNDDAPTE